MKILVVDDEKCMLEVIGFQLSEHSVTLVNNVALALELISKVQFDVVLTDYRMPDKDGLYLIKHLLEIKHPSKKILMSGCTDIEILANPLAKDITLLYKPFHLEDLELLLNKKKAVGE